MADDFGFVIPTLAALRDRIKGDIVSHTRTPASILYASLGYALSLASAAAFRAAYLYQQFVGKQIIPDRAGNDAMVRWCRLYGITKSAATKATGTVRVTGAAGSTVATGDVLQRYDATRYLVTGGPIPFPTSGTMDVTVEAETAGLGANYEWVSGAALTFVSPPAGIVASAPLKTSTPIAGGADLESDASLLARLLARLSQPPQGGSRADYEAWAQAALPSVDRVWVQTWTDPGSALTPGEVNVYFTIDGSGVAVIPAAGNVTTVDTYIQTARPVTADVTVAAPNNHVFNLALNVHYADGYSSADESDIEAALALEFESMFRDVAEVAEAGQTIPVSHLHDAIALVPGIGYYTLTDVDGGGPGADIVLAANEYPTVVASNIVITEV